MILWLQSHEESWNVKGMQISKFISIRSFHNFDSLKFYHEIFFCLLAFSSCLKCHEILLNFSNGNSFFCKIPNEKSILAYFTSLRCEMNIASRKLKIGILIPLILFFLLLCDFVLLWLFQPCVSIEQENQFCLYFCSH